MEADEMRSKMIEAGLSQNRPKSMCGCGKTRPAKNVRENVASHARHARYNTPRYMKKPGAMSGPLIIYPPI